MIYDIMKSFGNITAIVEHKNKPKEIHRFPNTVLNKGRESIANFLVNQNGQKVVYIQNMLFGDGGVNNKLDGSVHEQKRTVEADRNTLFGITRVNKHVVAQIDPLARTQAIFTAVITFEEANGFSLNEMALQLNNEDLFSMATFPDLGKTDQVQITFNWRISIV